MEKIKTTKVGMFLGCPTEYKLIGKGVTTASLSYGAKVTTEQYIHENNSTSSIDGYEVTSQLEQTCYKDEPVFEFIDGIRRKRGTGTDCESKFLVVYVYTGTDGNYEAEENNCVIEITDFKLEGGNPVSISYTIHLNGDPTLGTATIIEGEDKDTKTVSFTAG